MSLRISLAVLLALAALWTAPVPADARPQRETPEKLYDQGIRQMKRGYYDEAIISFDKVRNHFPLNQFSVLAELRVADCLYERADYISAVDAYQQFVRLHPRHEELDYAYMRVGRSYFKQANRIPAKDQTYTERTIVAIRDFEQRFPDSDYVEDVREMRDKCDARLAKSEMHVGDYYYWRKSWNAAKRRYVGVLDDFSTSPVSARARYRLGVCHYQLGELTEARAVLEQVQVLHPDTTHARRADRWLAKIEALPLDAS